MSLVKNFQTALEVAYHKCYELVAECYDAFNWKFQISQTWRDRVCSFMKIRFTLLKVGCTIHNTSSSSNATEMRNDKHDSCHTLIKRHGQISVKFRRVFDSRLLRTSSEDEVTKDGHISKKFVSLKTDLASIGTYTTANQFCYNWNSAEFVPWARMQISRPNSHISQIYWEFSQMATLMKTCVYHDLLSDPLGCFSLNQRRKAVSLMIHASKSCSIGSCWLIYVKMSRNWTRVCLPSFTIIR